MCPEGIEFTEGNIVYLVFGFAVAGEKDYLKLFQEIIALGKTQKKMKEILQQKMLFHCTIHQYFKQGQERVFDMKINIKEFTGNCSCGRDHQLVVDDVILEEGALKKLPEILNKEPYDQYKHLVMVCDDNTYEAAGKEVEKLLGGIPVIKLDPENLHANEIGVAKVKEQLDPIKEVDCMIAVGSGTIHDLTRYNAYERENSKSCTIYP